MRLIQMRLRADVGFDTMRRMQTKVKAQYWFPPKLVARQLNLTTATITRWARQGKFPNAKKIGRVWRIPKDDVDDL